MKTNLILDTDSYKTSHYLQYPPGFSGMHSYLESRGGKYEKTLFFGLQYIIREYLSKRLTYDDVIEASQFCKKHGVPFPEGQWLSLVRDHGGLLPISIKAVPEGSLVPVSNALMTVESTDPNYAWVVSWIETVLMRLWYPITVATQSFYMKKTIMEHLIRTSDDPDGEIGFKLHDFGSRGVSSRESAGIGGMAHLVNFVGSDTIEGVRFANHYYDCDMAAFSIPAAEHSTITAWGRDREEEAYANMVAQFCKPGNVVACVSDSYDLYHVVENVWGGSLRDQIEKSGATLVIRPDSGEPKEVLLKVFQILERTVGMKENTRGYKVLPRHFRVIQGDGVNHDSIKEILDAITEAGYSASNLNFGMGGALLQQVNRDTQKFAYKCSAAQVDGEWVDVYKDPKTDPGKTSKKGRLNLIINDDGEFQTVALTGATKHRSALKTVYHVDKNTHIMVDLGYSLGEIRDRANDFLEEELENE